MTTSAICESARRWLTFSSEPGLFHFGPVRCWDLNGRNRAISTTQYSFPYFQPHSFQGVIFLSNAGIQVEEQHQL